MGIHRTAVSLSLALLLVGAAHASGEVVLLGSGSLIEGTIERQPQVVIVRQGDDSIRLREGEVVHVGESKLAIYEYLRNHLANDTTNSKAGRHLRLAGWAMANQLLPQAALELLEARAVDPSHRRLALLERRLDELMRLATQPLTAPEPEATADVVQSSVDQSPSKQSGVIRTSSIDAEPSHLADSEPQPLPRLPDDGLSYFTRQIQPLLLNGCADCHRDEPGDKFPLDDSWRHGYGTAKSTDQNLRTALSALDIGSPAASPLVAAARGPHAGVTPLPGARHGELVQRLADWAQSIGQLNVVSLPPAPSGVQPMPAQFAATPLPSQQPMPAAEVTVAAAAFDPSVELASYEEVGEQQVPAPFGDTPSRPIQRGVQLKRVEPRDEFDPAIFNERFRRPEDDEALNGRPASR